MSPERFVEVHVATSAAKRKERDAQGAYAEGRPEPREEAPANPALTVSLDREEPEQAAERIVQMLVERGFLPALFTA